MRGRERFAWLAFGCALLGASRAAADSGSSEASWFSILAPGKGRPALVGDAACGSCHAAHAHTFHQTAHARTSVLASAATIQGSFAPGANLLHTANPDLTFVMEEVAGGFRQTARLRKENGEEVTRSESIDIVVGSGRKGQSYLYWDGDRLSQLPVSHWTEFDGWINSPGYVDGTADFDRPINPRCLECHASSFANLDAPSNRYDRTSLVLGISCERCHGPGSEHVARFRSATPPAHPADFGIVNPARLSRARQLDICALCHEGAGTSRTPPLTFTAGDPLAENLSFPRLPDNAHVDVHASQVQLLERSRCFRSSRTMTCTTCHDVHVAQRDPAAFSPKCLGCHQLQDCRRFPTLGAAIAGRCVDCHMPLQETAKIISRNDGVASHPKVRNHQIAVYPGLAGP
jgi:hypothetical protein